MRFVTLVIIIGFATSLFADEGEAPTDPPHPPQHLLELGLGAGMGFSPDYPGAEQSRAHYVPVPVLYFHGRILRSDREDGARARVVNQPIFGIDISGSGGFPIASEDNRARQGMPDLRWLGEVGPRGYLRLRDRRDQLWRVFLAGRAAFTSDLKKIEANGFLMAPGMGFEHKRLWLDEISAYSKVSSEFATKDYNTYFYAVDAASARPGRPQYQAKAGYLGTYWTNGISYETHDYLISGGLSLMFHDGSANRLSPLFKNEFNYAVFIGLAWFFYHSERPGYL